METKVTQRTEMSVEDFNKMILLDGSRINKYLDGSNPKIEYVIQEVGGGYHRGIGVRKVTKVILTVEKEV